MNSKVTNLDECYVMSQKDVADKLFLHINTVASDEKKAIEKIKKAFEENNINIKDYL